MADKLLNRNEQFTLVAMVAEHVTNNASEAAEACLISAVNHAIGGGISRELFWAMAEEIWSCIEREIEETSGQVTVTTARLDG